MNRNYYHGVVAAEGRMMVDVVVLVAEQDGIAFVVEQNLELAPCRMECLALGRAVHDCHDATGEER